MVQPVLKLVGGMWEHRKKKVVPDLELARYLGRERMESIPRHFVTGQRILTGHREGLNQATTLVKERADPMEKSAYC